MMEESTEAHMETDVSSTTEDVPETQEVTGSNGSVEMVIVVEEVKEEEMNSNAQIEKQPSLADANTNEVSNTSIEAPQIDTDIQKTPTKSPTKDVVLEPSPSKPEIIQKVVNKDLQPDSEIELSAEIQQTEDADSSMKDSPQNEIVDAPTSLQESPVKEQKRSPGNSPRKEVPTPVQMSPIKELQLSESARATPTKESLLVEKFVINGKVQSSDTSNDSSCKNITTIIPIDITIEREASNDSQVETNSIETNCSDTSEKDHNKSISRELKSLINSAKESKIISECTQLTSKTRKSRSALDSSNASLNTSVEPDKIPNIRRNSNNSQKSSCSEKSEKITVKRSMRSQNPEFVSKVKQFLNSVTGKGHKDSDDDDEDIEEKVKVNKVKEDSLIQTSPKIRKIEESVIDKSGKLRTDPFCWRCHWAVEEATNEKMHAPMHCTVCPRTFHYKCLTINERNKISTEKSWVCPECMIVLQAESSETRSPAMKKTSLGVLCELLKHALERMMDLNGVEPFMQPVDRTAFPHYDKYVVHPMDLSLMRHNITEGLYGSTEAFLADAQWILHNSIIFNTLQSKLTAGARALVRGCRAEMGEIEACPECYAAAHARRPTWFTDVCTTPHILLWAKLKGFPYWPAKGMSVSSAGHVDVRFFGAHDRAWVPAKDCFLYSEKDPNNFRTKRQDIIDSMQEAEEHIRNISRKYGKFVYPPFKTQFDPTKLTEQLKMMIPSFEGEVQVRAPLKEKSNASPNTAKKSRSNSKSSKCSINDGDISENEETPEGEQPTPVSSRKMADGAEIAREEDETNADKSETAMDVDTNKTSEPSQTTNTSETPSQSIKSNEISRKRRRSDLVEAVITIMDGAPETKRKKSDNKHEKDKKNSDDQEPSSSKEVEDKPTPTKSKNGPVEDNNNDESNERDSEPSSSTRPDSDKEKGLRVTPIRIALVQKDRRHNLRTSTAKEAMAKIITPIKVKEKDKEKDKDNDKTTSLRLKSTRTDKADKPTEKTPKEDKLTRSEKRRNSRNNRSLSSTPKSEKPRRISLEKKSEKTAETSFNKDKSKENVKENKDKVKDSKEKESDPEKSRKEKVNSPKPTSSDSKSVKDRLQFDDDTTLAVIAREARTVVISHNSTGLPTISCVRSLSTTAQNTPTTSTKVTTTTNTTPITIEINPDSLIIPVSESTNAKDASKLQKLRNDAEPTKVGRVGVRAFARMTSPERTNKNDDVQVEIKAEPIDVDDADRQIEKLNLMNAFRLRPVNPPQSNLREVRINKVLVTPLNAKKTANKSVEVRPRAKKTFPQPKKPEDSQLNSKNSMVYIPIQPPMTQAPVRPQRVVSGPICSQPIVKPVPASTINSVVSTLSAPAPPTCSAAVHTLPLMTSVNGQWMFSFQPVMSVGAIENSPSPPILNGVAERTNTSIISLPSNQTNQPSGATVSNNTTVPTLLATATKASDSHTPGEPPRLQQRPTTVLMNPLDANTPVGIMPTPSTAGPVTAKLNQNAVKLTDFFRTLLEDSLEKLDEPATQVTTLKLQLEQTNWKHQAEIKEIKHNHELTLAEMRALFEKEKVRAVAEARRTAQVELEAAVKLAKSKQWCANCSQEAQFYCCWNTSYCDYPCQRAHWSQHFNVCTQQRLEGSNNGELQNPPESRLQPQPDNLPKNSSAPAMTVGGKLALSRGYTQDPSNTNAQKNAIIVSMVEDHSGNQTMKCVGTYKPTTTAQNNTSPIIINKQIMSSEEKSANANKKVVSSGGYLIVGGGVNNSTVVTPARRAHAIQYFT